MPETNITNWVLHEGLGRQVWLRLQCVCNMATEVYIYRAARLGFLVQVTVGLVRLSLCHAWGLIILVTTGAIASFGVQ